MADPSALQDVFGLTGGVLEGQYRVDRVVGEGGFGVVYRGHHMALDQPVAIKLLKGLDVGDPRINAVVLEKFREEARLLYTLSQASLHIVRAIHFAATTTPSGVWAPFMVLEWLDGRSLADDLRDRQRQRLGGRSLAEAMPILAGVAEGLIVAHAQQVAHRDIKPANVFLLDPPANAPAPTGPRVKLLDFGIAKIMNDGGGSGPKKGTLASFTWLYAAPEQLEPRIGSTGLPTDVYAFALLVTELLTGKPPMDERDTVSIMHKAMDPVVRPTPRTCGANVSDEVEAVCLKALAVDPKHRYPNMAEMWAALGQAMNRRSSTSLHQAIGSRPTPAPQPAAPPQHPYPQPPSHPVSAGPRPGAPLGYPPGRPWGPSPPLGSAPPGGWGRLPWRPTNGQGANVLLGLVIGAVLFVVLFGGCMAVCVSAAR